MKTWAQSADAASRPENDRLLNLVIRRIKARRKPTPILPQPDGFSMSGGEITLAYSNIDDAHLAFDRIEALIKHPIK